ncbi:hypothetical protein [Natronoglycomyces albus]|uniref:Uncharacterized protein n=1 Tax=Natronoglycomyces albus TaxID=2811108 RepID=A0A895XMY6_9ACTN|nr:hypothetical protein [Natronoglycomyces albus]QSB06487.1 hypothetical protein JQS30_06180 [Natronoglycomyces albus]
MPQWPPPKLTAGVPEGHAVLVASGILASSSGRERQQSLWLLDEGLLVANLEMGTQSYDLPGRGAAKQRRLTWTTHPLSSAEISHILAQDPRRLWLPWADIASARSYRLSPAIRLHMRDGSKRTLRPARDYTAISAHLLDQAMSERGVPAQIATVTPHGARKVATIGWVTLGTCAVVAIALLAVTWNDEAEIRDRAIERWSVEQYGSQTPVAVIAAEAIDAQPLEWIRSQRSLYAISDDQVLVDFPGRGSRYGSSTECWRLDRNGDYLAWSRLGRGPCDREGYVPADIERTTSADWIDDNP